ncbi:MAG TPA: DUF6125 family protein [Dissulfurispiraceae bacterium]
MSGEIIERMSRDELREYIASLLWQFRLADAFWFINVENLCGLAEAEAMNGRVWAKVGQLGARDILKRFGPFEPGAKGFWQAYSLFPWSVILDYKVEEEGGDLIVTVPDCPAQEGRKKHGKGEYVCKHMHMAEFRNFAAVISPEVKVECLFAPPDSHPEDCYCKWRFSAHL